MKVVLFTIYLMRQKPTRITGMTRLRGTAHESNSKLLISTAQDVAAASSRKLVRCHHEPLDVQFTKAINPFPSFWQRKPALLP